MAADKSVKTNGLRTLAQSKGNQRAPLFEQVKAYIGEYLSACLITFAPPPPKNSMCKYYGHVVDKKNWAGEFPPCADCGAMIKSQSELRKAEVQKVEAHK